MAHNFHSRREYREYMELDCRATPQALPALAPVLTPMPGEEQYINYFSSNTRGWLCQYDYRADDGVLFSCVGKDLVECRAKRDEWLSSR